MIEKEPMFKCLNSVESKEISYLVDDIIPLGFVTIIFGSPGTGKTSFISKIIADKTTGKCTIKNINNSESIKVLYLSLEESAHYLLKPRFERYGANCTNIHILNDKVSLFLEDDELEEHIIKHKPKLLVIDPLQSFVRGDMNKTQEMYPLITKLNYLAEKYNLAIVILMHANRMQSITNAEGRMAGAHGLQGAVRNIFLIGKIASNKEISYLIHIKSNIGKLTKSIAFKVTDTVEWLGECDINEADIFLREDTKSPLNRAMDFLKKIFSEKSEIPANEVKELSQNEDFSERTLEKAKSILNIQSKRIRNVDGNMMSVWYKVKIN